MVTDESLQEVLFLKHGDLARTGWGPRLRKRFNYCTPDDIYEALLLKLVAPGTRWLDVGGGRDLFPSNEALARLLSRRAESLVGVDPSRNILDNPFVHVRVQSPIEDFHSNQTFDLITLRMVAEHIANPAAVVQSLERLAGAAGLIVIYTVNKWSAVTLLSAVTPLGAHHFLKKMFWRVDERDTFEVEYRMNTRSDLAALFRVVNFRETDFIFLPDCRLLARWKFWNRLELSAWKLLTSVGLSYPETCLLGVYQRAVSPGHGPQRL